MADGVECIWPVAALLGEGPLWDGRADALWFVDIKGGRVHRLDPASGARDTIAVGGRPSFVVPADDGGFLVGDGAALRRFDGRAVTGLYRTVAMPAHNRFNDAAVDPAGGLWFGSMDDGEQAPTGRVYHHKRGAIHEAGGACVITNGPAITGDGRHLYHVDTLAGLIWRFPLDGTARLERGEVFARIDPADGHPDGVTIDAEDHLWVGLWGGWAARRYAPDGTLAATIRFPCANVTKVAFGGAGLRTAFATTARVGLDAAALADQPLAGGLFAFAAPAPGRAVPEVRLGTDEGAQDQ